jgi:hypothetical protein
MLNTKKQNTNKVYEKIRKTYKNYLYLELKANYFVQGMYICLFAMSSHKHNISSSVIEGNSRMTQEGGRNGINETRNGDGLTMLVPSLLSLISPSMQYTGTSSAILNISSPLHLKDVIDEVFKILDEDSEWK